MLETESNCSFYIQLKLIPKNSVHTISEYSFRSVLVKSSLFDSKVTLNMFTSKNVIISVSNIFRLKQLFGGLLNRRTCTIWSWKRPGRRRRLQQKLSRESHEKWQSSYFHQLIKNNFLPTHLPASKMPTLRNSSFCTNWLMKTGFECKGKLFDILRKLYPFV